MAFDKSLDKELWAKQIDIERGRITVAVMCYNEGQKKLQIGRENKNAEGEYSFAKLGRMTKEEAELVIPAAQEALQHMD